MYLALKQKISMRILDMKIFKPIKECYTGPSEIDWLYLIKFVWNVL